MMKGENIREIDILIDGTFKSDMGKYNFPSHVYYLLLSATVITIKCLNKYLSFIIV